MQFIQWLLIAVVTIPLILVFINKLRMDVAPLLMVTLSGGLQFFGLSIFGPAQSPKDAIQSISGFAQPVVITLIALFIITRGLKLG